MSEFSKSTKIKIIIYKLLNKDCPNIDRTTIVMLLWHNFQNLNFIDLKGNPHIEAEGILSKFDFS